MGLKCGIVGLPNVGKSTLFNCLSNARAQAANFPFCTIEPNLGTIIVPDERLNQLADIVKPQNILPTTVEIVDIAGLVKGASKGEGLGNQFLANIRECNAIIHVLRCFEDENIVHVDGSVNPVRDKEVIDTELQLKDLESLEKAFVRIEKQARVGGDKESKKKVELYQNLRTLLEQGKSARSAAFTPEEWALVDDLFLLTAKPVIYVCNVEEQHAEKGNAHSQALMNSISGENASVLTIAVAIEAEIAQLESYEERKLFLQDLGLEDAGVNKLIQSAYHLLDLQTYFTAGVKEVRAWTIEKGFTAPQAAGVIHTDFEKGFIRAEVITFDDYIRYGSEQAVKEAGKMRVEGKEYIVQDGDIMHFRFNV
ncbi:MAG: redox-regulated ATPase YchF [Candidatus Competibacteraceae bacterium]|nr:redox-regulated ATPase YchF [Candidatus Competibacteraceae bacterium]